MKRDLDVRKETYIYETKMDLHVKRDLGIHEECDTYEKGPEGSLMSSGDVCRICSTRELQI